MKSSELVAKRLMYPGDAEVWCCDTTVANKVEALPMVDAAERSGAELLMSARKVPSFDGMATPRCRDAVRTLRGGYFELSGEMW